MDRLTEEQRRKNMQAVKSCGSAIETILMKALWKRGYRYRKNYKALPGKPDIVLLKYKVAIFCDSEFWHGCDWENKKKEIKSNREFWIRKIEANISRDKYVNDILKERGWTVLRFWGKEIKKNTEGCLSKTEETLEKLKKTA
jgi:DNA mismatch endonuclease (patch repair protein)